MYTWKYDERWNKNTAKSIYSGPFIGTPSIPIVPAPIFQLKLQDLIISMWSLVFNPLLLAKKPRWIRFFFFFRPFFFEYKNQVSPQTNPSNLGSYFVQATPRAAPEEEEGKAQGGTTDGERPSVKWREDPEVQEVPEAWRTRKSSPDVFLKKTAEI